jgi:hypothetical protein
MILLVAVKESPSGAVCNQLDLCCAFCRYENDVFVQSVHLWTSFYLLRLKRMPLQINGMVVRALIFYDRTVSHPGLELTKHLNSLPNPSSRLLHRSPDVGSSS